MLKNVPPSVWFCLVVLVASLGWMVYRDGWLFTIIFSVMALAVIGFINWFSNWLDRNFENRKS